MPRVVEKQPQLAPRQLQLAARADALTTAQLDALAVAPAVGGVATARFLAAGPLSFVGLRLGIATACASRRAS